MANCVRFFKCTTGILKNAPALCTKIVLNSEVKFALTLNYDQSFLGNTTCPRSILKTIWLHRYLLDFTVSERFIIYLLQILSYDDHSAFVSSLNRACHGYSMNVFVLRLSTSPLSPRLSLKLCSNFTHPKGILFQTYYMSQHGNIVW